jgi:hypothetical protein
MNCDEFQNIVTELARDQMMEATARSQALAHSARCEDCALRLENERHLTAGLRSLASEMESLEAGPEVEARVLAAFRNRKAVVSTVGRSRRWYWAGAAAAAVLLVFGVVAIRGLVTSTGSSDRTATIGEPPKPAPTHQDQIVPSPIPQETPIPVAGDPKPHREFRPSRGGRPNQPATTLVSDSTNSEIATDFFPVGDGRAVNLQDGGQLMRVEVPRSTMARFGLPVNFERGNERVKADVLVSTDGLARAIRFVQ